MRPDAAAVEVRRHVSAAPAQVFEAFSEASLVSRWLTPSPQIPMRVLHFDFRVGGRYRFAYDVSAAQTVIINGLYRAIEPPSTIVARPRTVHARMSVAREALERGTGARGLRALLRKLSLDCAYRLASPSSPGIIRGT